MTEAEWLTMLGGVGGNAILVLVVWALMTGRMVTRFHYDDMKSTMQSRIDLQLEIIRRLRDHDSGA